MGKFSFGQALLVNDSIRHAAAEERNRAEAVRVIPSFFVILAENAPHSPAIVAAM